MNQEKKNETPLTKTIWFSFFLYKNLVISEKNHIFVPKGLIKTQEIMALVDLDNFIESLMWMWNSPETATFFNDLKLALDKQGLAYKDGKIIKTQRRISAEAKETGYGEPEDKEKPNGGIVLEDFNEGDGFYKVNLAYLSKEQVEEIENIAKKWNPELKESEDEGERIRKMLIKFFGKGAEYNSSTNGIFDKDILAWLEKQGNTDFEFFENGENEKREFVGYGFLKCKGDFLSFKEGETYWLEYVGKDNYNVRSDNLLGQTFHITPRQLYTVFRPTTWLEKQGTSYTKRDVDDAYVEGMAFAKNELEKQKSSWSKEDEKMKDLIISVLEVNHSKGIFKAGLRAIRTEEIVSWLKSLKQRYTWKPSEEQMKALHDMNLTGNISYAGQGQTLIELYNDLKKL